MARTSSADPIEKFRFIVTIFQPSKAFVAVNGTSTLTPSSSNRGSALGRAGFKEATLPEVKVATVKYRENIDGLASRKIAGLAEYTPVTFRRGVMSETSLFDLFTDTDNEASTLNTFNSALAGDFGAISFQNTRYRKDILISVTDRSGNFIKHWYLSNAFVIGYKGGNDLDASIDDKLIEEIIFDYEFFLETTAPTIDAALHNISAMADAAARQQAAAKAVSLGVGAVASLF